MIAGRYVLRVFPVQFLFQAQMHALYLGRLGAGAVQGFFLDVTCQLPRLLEYVDGGRELMVKG